MPSEHSLKSNLEYGQTTTEPLCPSHITERKLVAKIDIRLIPILVLVYILAFLDRVNISNALTLGLPEELKLNNVTDQQSNIALAIFFVPYVLLEIPSNWLMKKFKPHVWLSGCITFFGIFMLAQGFVKSYGALLATRFFLGLAEAGIFPGCKCNILRACLSTSSDTFQASISSASTTSAASLNSVSPGSSTQPPLPLPSAR